LVVGRPIYRSTNPHAAAGEIMKEMDEAFSLSMQSQ
jgi:orotidine-5'-phosphate decarboxylase